MHTKKIVLSTSGIDSNCASRINTYCRLLNSKLKDYWETSQLDHDYQVIIRNYTGDTSAINHENQPTIYLVNREVNVNQLNGHFNWYLNYPIYSDDLVTVLNDISTKVKIRKTRIRKKGHISEKVSNLLMGLPQKRVKADKPNKEKKQGKFLKNLIAKIAPNKQNSYKVVFLGPPGSGKTTAIENVSNFSAFTTEVSPTDSVGSLKAKTTIGIDYGEFKHKHLTLCLYGTPGQQRYDYMRRLSIKNANVYVVLLDMTSEDPMADLSYLNNLVNLSANDGVLRVIALTHLDLSMTNPEIIKKRISEKSAHNVVMTQIDPRKKNDVEKMLIEIAEAMASKRLLH